MEWTTIQLPKTLLEQVSEVLKSNPYWTGPTEFVRDAVREKLLRLAQLPDRR